MIDEKKQKKQIENYGKHIVVWLDEVEKGQKKLMEETNKKKQEKLNRKIETDKKSLKQNIEWLVQAGGNPEDYLQNISEVKKSVLEEIFSSGVDRSTVAIQKEIRRIKKMLNEDLKECMAKYSYNPEDPIEVKRKNKLFYREAYISWDMLRASALKSLGGDENKHYNSSWNYTRDYETTRNQYFTPEEQQLIANCMRTHEEELAFYKVKRAWMARLGASLVNAADKIEAWGDITQAKLWAKNLSAEIFPDVVKEIEGGGLSGKELEQKSKEMARRYIQFIENGEDVEASLAVMKECEEEAGRQLEELKRGSENAEGLPFLELRELKKVEEMAEEEVGGVNMLTFYLLRERLGIEKAGFVMLYTYDSLKEERRELLTTYSLEELGL